MPRKYTIRPVDPTDEDIRDQLNRLDKELFPHDFLAQKTGYWWIVYHGKKPVAFAGVRQSHQWETAGYLCRVGVTEDHRGRGLQKRLLRVREAKARRLGWHYLVTDTQDNPASANSLISCGYKMYSPQKPWANEGACYWRKKL